MMKRFLKWFWYGRKKVPVEPMPVNFPAAPGTLRFVFSNVDKAPQVIVYCFDSTVVSHAPVESKEVELVLHKPAIAMGVIKAPDNALLEQVYAGPLAMMRGPILAMVFDVARTVTYFVPRWRLIKEWVVHLGLRLRYGRKYREVI